MIITTLAVAVNVLAGFMNLAMIWRREKELRRLRAAVADATPCVMMVGFLAHKEVNVPTWIKDRCVSILPPTVKVTVTHHNFDTTRVH